MLEPDNDRQRRFIDEAFVNAISSATVTFSVEDKNF